MKTTFYSLLFIFAFLLSKAQAGKCKTETDKETKREYYTIADIESNAPYGFSALEFIQANFRLPKREFRKKDKISFSWIVEPTGALTFLKMNSFKDDKDILEETKRIISLMPNYAPSFCGKAKVPFKMDISFSVEWLKKGLQ